MLERSTASFEEKVRWICENEQDCLYRIHFRGLEKPCKDTLRVEVINVVELDGNGISDVNQVYGGCQFFVLIYIEFTKNLPDSSLLKCFAGFWVFLYLLVIAQAFSLRLARRMFILSHNKLLVNNNHIINVLECVLRK